MAHSSLLLLLFFCAAAAGGSSFDESNPIRLVSDGLRDFEEQVQQVIGESRHALSFSRFARRFGKRYETAEEMKQRFGIFSENLKLIRSTNRKRLSYTVGVNRMCC